MERGAFMKKIVTYYNKIEAHLLVASLLFTVVLIFGQVVLRYVFQTSLSWSEELARYIFIWQIWLGTSVAQKDRVHVRIQIFQGTKKQRYFTIAADVIWLLFCLFLVVYGFNLVWSIKSRRFLSAALRLPMYLVYASLPLSQLAMMFRVGGEIKDEVKAIRSGEGVETA